MSPRRREGPYFNAKRGTYYVDVYVGFPPNQTRIRKSLRTADPKRATWLWEREYKREWDKYYGVASDIPTRELALQDLAPLYVSFIRDAAKVKTWFTFKRRLEYFMEAVGPGKLPSEIGPADFRKLEIFLTTPVKKKGRSGIKFIRSRTTINHYVGVIKAFYNWAIREGHYTGDNPTKRIKRYTVDRKRREYSDEEIRRILAAAAEIEANPPMKYPIMAHARRLVTLLLLTAMRAGEALGLRWASVKDDRIVLERTETKQAKEKIIPLTPGVKSILDELRAFDNGSGQVFPVPAETYWHTRFIISEIRKRAGIPGFVLHGLRHTAAAIMVQEALGRGAGMEDVMRVLGHSKIETTLHYDHSRMDRMRKAMEALESRVGK